MAQNLKISFINLQFPPLAMRNLCLSALLALVFISGCLGQAAPQECSSFVGEAQRGVCTYEKAVLAQAPSLCYSIADMKLRETCLLDANNPDAAARLADRIASGLPPIEPELEAQSPALPQVPSKPPSDEIEVCMESQKLSRDACTRAVAIEFKDLTLCEKISAGEYRESCIANIAISKKKLADCSALGNPTDRQLCTSYSTG